MDKAKLIERRDALVRNREQIVANLNMLQGMVEEINFWIRAIEAEEAAEDVLEAEDDAAMELEYANKEVEPYEPDGCDVVMEENAKSSEADADTEAEAEKFPNAPDTPEAVEAEAEAEEEEAVGRTQS